MSAQPSLKVVKSFPYEGGTKLWSNRYHFTGANPAGSTEWTTLMDNVTADEKILYTSNVTIVEAIGYNAGSDVPVFSKSYSIEGTLTSVASVPAPGDCAAILRYSTDARSTKNHPVYLFNYFHGVILDSTVAGDIVKADQKAHIEDVAADWIAGYSDGTNTRVRCGPNGAVALGYLVDQYVRHRDFPR